MPTDIHLPPKIGVSHLHIFEEGVFCRKTINSMKYSMFSLICLRIK
ncbi:fibronectin (plasmid) [Bacillus thuringiensis]|nr:fibronectin [Bacillus sp. M13(2017)]QCY64975.1 fibronectin [Bacillus thuringiensis]